MITPSPLIAATHLRLKHRICHGVDGRIRMCRSDGQAVFTTAAQLDDIVAGFDRVVRPINRRLRWSFNLAIPVMLLSLAFWAKVDPTYAIDRPPQPISTIACVGVLMWWPFAALFFHWRSMRRADAWLDTLLQNFPRAPMPPSRPVAFHTLEILAVFLVGPGLLIDLIGSLSPHQFDGTPLMGRSIGLGTVVGLIVFALLAWRAWQRRTGRFV